MRGVNSKIHFQGESHPFPLDNPGYWSMGSAHLLPWAVGTVLNSCQAPEKDLAAQVRVPQLCRCFRSPKIQTAPENFELFPYKRSQEIWCVLGKPVWPALLERHGSSLGILHLCRVMFYFLLGCPAALQQTMSASGGSDSPCKFKSHVGEQGIHLRAEIIAVSCRLSHPGSREGKPLAVQEKLGVP